MLKDISAKFQRILPRRNDVDLDLPGVRPHVR
jgi:hypothetical protein